MIRPFLVGFATTLKHIFRKPITVNYPDEKVPVFPKWRGKQVLMRDENGLEKCVACGLCAVACPADAIYLEPAENDGSVQAGPRYAKVYQIHKTRCIFCGYCEEACPVSAIFMGKDYELAVYSNKDFIWDKHDLLVPASAAPRRQPARCMPKCQDAKMAAHAGVTAQLLAIWQSRHLGNALRRSRRHPRRLRERAPRHGTAPRGAVLALCRRHRGRRGPLRSAAGAALLDQGQQRELRRHRGRRLSRQPALPAQRRRRATIGGLRVAGLGGTFAPTWYETPAAALPHPRKGTAKATELADKRRHFVREEVEACKALRDVDVFLTHEAPRPYFAGSGTRRIDAGKTPINEVLAAMQPRLHLFGHHHRFTEQDARGRPIGRPRSGVAVRTC